MRRIAMLLGTVGVVALGLAGSPAQAQQAGWGYYGSQHPQSHAAAWREHEARQWAWRRHEWREHHYRPAWYAPYGYYR